MDPNSYASSFIKSRILPENRNQALINLDEFGTGNYLGLGPQTPKTEKKPEMKNKKAILLPRFRGKSMKQLKRLLRREQSSDFRRDKTCPAYLPKRLNELWSKYAQSLINWSGVDENANVSSRLENVPRMDLIGARLRVLRSITTKQVDLEGIIMMETRNIFILATEEEDVVESSKVSKARLHMVPKRGTVLLLFMPNAEVLLNGNSLTHRPIDRTLRKWKTNQSSAGKRRRGVLHSDLFSDFVFSATDPSKDIQEV